MLRQGAFDSVPRGPGAKMGAAVEATEKPGTLLKVMADNVRFAFLNAAAGNWTKHNDVALYDAHPLSNNNREPAKLLQVPSDPADPRCFGVGPELMFGHVVGEKLADPVLLIRFATKHPIWLLRGSRSLGYDYLPPSSGGGLDFDGCWNRE